MRVYILWKNYFNQRLSGTIEVESDTSTVHDHLEILRASLDINIS